jgi:hypothetical protein
MIPCLALHVNDFNGLSTNVWGTKWYYENNTFTCNARQGIITRVLPIFDLDVCFLPFFLGKEPLLLLDFTTVDLGVLLPKKKGKKQTSKSNIGKTFDFNGLSTNVWGTKWYMFVFYLFS